MKIKNKKGVSLYISWILLMLLIISLSAIMYNWYNSRAKKSADILKEQSTEDICNKVGILIEELCQNTQTLNINISNRKDIKINQLIFGLIDIYKDPETKKVNVTIYPGDTEQIELIKQGTLYQVDVIPVVVVDGITNICTNSKVFKNNIAQC